jgi:hypothetical protein
MSQTKGLALLSIKAPRQAFFFPGQFAVLVAKDLFYSHFFKAIKSNLLWMKMDDLG